MTLRDVFRADWDLANSRTLPSKDAHGWEPFAVAVEDKSTILYFRRRVGFAARLWRWFAQP